MKQYTYEGEVFAFGEKLADNWVASTWAPTPEKAMSNLKFRFRKTHYLENCTPLEMPGELVES